MPDADQSTLQPDIEPIEIQEEVERSFLDYAMSVIVSRALPDARDGLKPVHRRILYGMYDRGLRPERQHTKSAQVVGHVMGNFHPHGDQAIYDALARMTQDFSLRHPLIDGHGNFGSPDPLDRPGAMRYCLTGDTRVRTVDGTVPIRDLAPVEPDSEVDIERKVLDRDGEPVLATKLFHSGDHPTLRLRTTEGFELTGTHNHPVLCLVDVDGVPVPLWKLLDEIRPGDRVMISRAPATDHQWANKHELDSAFLAGAWVAEGHASANRAGFNNVDEGYFDAVAVAYDKVVGGARYHYRRRLPSGKTIHELDVQRLDSFLPSPLGELVGAKSSDKQIPDFVWAAPLEAKQEFLKALYEGDGSCSSLGRNSLQVCYSTRSDRLARDIQILLLEFGAVAPLARYENGEIKVVISNRRDARLFAERVGFWGAKQQKLETIMESLPKTRSSNATDRIPLVAGYIRAESGSRGDDRRWLAKHSIDRIDDYGWRTREIFGRIRSEEVKRVVAPLFMSNWYYATVREVVPAGVQPVYSVRVESDDHSFLSNGFVSHNTECRLTKPFDRNEWSSDSTRTE